MADSVELANILANAALVGAGVVVAIVLVVVALDWFRGYFG